jgi:putative ABC transport system permease protein
MNFWKTASRIAWREARASRAKFAFVVISVAIGVGALTGVRGFSEALSGMLSKEARTLLGADIGVRMTAVPSEAQLEAVRSLERKGARSTWVTETFTMASGGRTPDPVPVSLKVIDPAVYPFYGKMTLDRQAPMTSLLKDDTLVVSEDLRIRLSLVEGDTVRIGGVPFRVTAFLLGEPDRLVSGPAFGPRVLMTRGGLEKTGLIQLGSRAPQRILFRVANDKQVDEVRTFLKKTFDEDRVTDYREVNQNVTKALDDTRNFLSMISLVALIVGAIGVGTAMYAHLQQKLDSIAVMKSIGARASQIVQIYLVQTLMLGLAGGVLGVAVGALLQRVFPVLLARFLKVQPDLPWVPSSAAQGLLAGLLTTLLFTLPPLLSIRKVKPALVLRRDMQEVSAVRSWRRRLADSRSAIASAVFVILGITAIAIWLMGGIRPESIRIGSYFVGGLVGSLLALSAVAWLLLRMLRLIVRMWGSRLPSTFRHGVSNLYRPGSQTTAILTSLGIGVMFTLTVYLVQHSLLGEIKRNSPPGMSNVFLLDITEEQRPQVAEMISKQKGIEAPPDFLATVSAKVAAIDGTKSEDLKAPGRARAFAARRVVTWADRQPEGVKIADGAWWKSDTEPSVAVAEWMAKYMNAKVGSRIDWVSFGRPISTRVAAIYRSDPQRLGSRLEFIFSPGVLEGLPVVYYGAVRVNPPQVASLQRAAYEKFPTMTVLNMADIITRIQEVVDQVSFVIRFISLFAILAGATILASSVAGSRFRRMREVVIFKTLGATRARIARMFSAEFLILGAVAGAMGSLLATGFSQIVLSRIMRLRFEFEIVPLLWAMLLTALIAALAGWLASWRVLGQKPLDVLREQG